MAQYANGVSENKDFGSVPGDRAAADGPPPRGRRCGCQRLRACRGHEARRVRSPRKQSSRRTPAAASARRRALDNPKYAESFALRAQERHGSHNAGESNGLSPGRPSLIRDRRAEFLALAGELRPDLRRCCGRFMGRQARGQRSRSVTAPRGIRAGGAELGFVWQGPRPVATFIRRTSVHPAPTLGSGVLLSSSWRGISTCTGKGSPEVRKST
jgi:hypothetical protein